MAKVPPSLGTAKDWPLGNVHTADAFIELSSLSSSSKIDWMMSDRSILTFFFVFVSSSSPSLREEARYAGLFFPSSRDELIFFLCGCVRKSGKSSDRSGLGKFIYSDNIVIHFASCRDE